MRISDWSSDVCSSDLTDIIVGAGPRAPASNSIVGAERVAQPVERRRGRIAAGIDHGEAAGRHGKAAVPGEEGPRRRYQLAPQAGVHRSQAHNERWDGGLAHTHTKPRAHATEPAR